MNNKRIKYKNSCNSLEEGLELVYKLFKDKEYFKAFDMLEYMLDLNSFNDIKTVFEGLNFEYFFDLFFQEFLRL